MTVHELLHQQTGDKQLNSTQRDLAERKARFERRIAERNALTPPLTGKKPRNHPSTWTVPTQDLGGSTGNRRISRKIS
ncbi:hypothetical protein HY345_01575 [Candidatus Microgenomates bacterium]|nr:hypothetical protein [Candidatus Microgenomates bacterium]